MASARRPVWVLVAVVVAIAVGLWWCRRSAPPDAPAVAAAAAAPRTAASAATEVGHAMSPPGSTADAAPSRADARARRDALREQILRQLAQRPAAASGGIRPAARAGSASAAPPDGLRNKMDERHQAVVDALNRDFMPLAKECVEQAQQRAPQLTGMVALAMETVADEQLGAVVDVAEPAPTNQIADPLLFECLRESAFSLSLPPPPTGGRMKALITLKMED